MDEVYFAGFFFRSHQDRTIFFRALKFERVFLLKSENFQFSKFRVLGISNNLKVANFLNFEFDQFLKKKNICNSHELSNLLYTFHNLEKFSNDLSRVKKIILEI